MKQKRTTNESTNKQTNLQNDQHVKQANPTSKQSWTKKTQQPKKMNKREQPTKNQPWLKTTCFFFEGKNNEKHVFSKGKNPKQTTLQTTPPAPARPPRRLSVNAWRRRRHRRCGSGAPSCRGFDGFLMGFVYKKVMLYDVFLAMFGDFLL